jgi:hypothetical protein
LPSRDGSFQREQQSGGKGILHQWSPTMTADTAAPSLKPCPFCGEPPDVTETGWTTTIHCGNESCGCDVEATGTERHVVAEAWNTRATPPAPTPSAERIAKIVRDQLLQLDIGCGEDCNIHDAIAHLRGDADVGDAVVLIADVSAWIADAILALLPDAAAIRAAAFEEAALTDIAAERKRQREVEGWTTGHDDGHDTGEMAGAAACYALSTIKHWAKDQVIKMMWPWADEWWKPKDRRRNLVRAAALIVAEIERIDRAAAIRAAGEK